MQLGSARICGRSVFSAVCRSRSTNSLYQHVNDTILKSLKFRGLGESSQITNVLTHYLIKRVSNQHEQGSRDYNRVLSEECDLLSHWLMHVSNGTEITSGRIDVDNVVSQMKQRKFSGFKTYDNITDHHHNIRDISWNDTVQNKKALSQYSVAAQEMGQRLWVTEGNRWMVRTINDFFHGGGVQRQFGKDALANSPCIPTDTGVRDWVRSLALSHRLSDREPLRVLDVGSCYNPLVVLSQEEDVALDVTAIDLCPAREHAHSVLQCDFLSLRVGPALSPPIISPPTENSVHSKSPAGTRQLLQLPAAHFHAVCMSLVMSYLPSGQIRRLMITKARELLTQPAPVPPLNKHSTSESISKECLSYGLLLIVETYGSKYSDGTWIGGVPRLKMSVPADSPVADEMASEKHLEQEMLSLGFQKINIAPLVVKQGKLSKRKAITMAFRTTAGTPAASLGTRQEFSTHILPVGIVGCGIGGAALARKLEREKVPYVVFESDANVSSRRQGYALTLQQGLVALRDLAVTADGMRSSSVADPLYTQSRVKKNDDDDIKGKCSTVKGCTSTHSHVSLTDKGKVIGVYGAPSPVAHVPLCGDRLFTLERETLRSHQISVMGDMNGVRDGDNCDGRNGSVGVKSTRGRKNVHMPRQALRAALLEGVPDDKILWNHRLKDVEEVKPGTQRSRSEDESELLLTFDNNKQYRVSGLVGADGIYSAVRRQCFSAALNCHRIGDPLNYLGLVVILGICPTLVRNNMHTELDSWTHGELSLMAREAEIRGSGSSLSRRKIQWLDGATRVFSMPYDEDNVMWQLSFHMKLDEILCIVDDCAGVIMLRILTLHDYLHICYTKLLS
jgi:hypothetical protein